MLDIDALSSMIADIVGDEVSKAVTPLKAENEELKERLKVLEERPVPEKGEKGDDGSSPEPEAVAAALLPIAEEMIAEAVSKAVAELPPPERGPPGERGADGAPGTPGEKGADGKDGRDGKDGAGIIDGFVSRDGHLIATLSDGTTRDFGEIVGKDGRDGVPGRDGIDLTSFDAIVLEDDRTIELKFASGDEQRVASFKWPTAIYRGVFKEGGEYERGDMVTWAGSLWHCDTPTKEKPGTDDWTLAVKKGRDGKDKTKE